MTHMITEAAIAYTWCTLPLCYIERAAAVQFKTWIVNVETEDNIACDTACMPVILSVIL